MNTALEEILLALEDLSDAVFSMGLQEEEEKVVLKAAKKAMVKNWNNTHSGENEITETEQRGLLNKINEE